MDDFLIISEDVDFLMTCMKEITEYLTGLKFTINEKKTRIYSIRDGIDFLGFTFRITDTGKILMQIRSENVKRQGES